MEAAARHPDWLTIQQLSERWSMGYDTVRRDVLTKKIPSLKVGSIYRISRKWIEEAENKAIQAEIKTTLRRARRGEYVTETVDHYPDC